MSLRKIGKIYGEKTFGWHRRIKGANKKLSSRIARRRLNREFE
jgi:hypothetical protein